MIRYITYDEQGTITSIGSCKESDVPNKADSFQGRLLVIDQDITPHHRVVNGSIVLIEETDQVRQQAIVAVARSTRNAILSETDWTQLPDAPISENTRQAYRVYRQALRDLPSNLGPIKDLSDITWPDAPVHN